MERICIVVIGRVLVVVRMCDEGELEWVNSVWRCIVTDEVL